MPSLKHCLVLVLFTLIAISATAEGFSFIPPSAKTGAPNEATCNQCHGGGAVGGEVTVEGVPSQYEPGMIYELTVMVNDAAASRFGFEMTAIDQSGEGAGTFVVLDSGNTSLTPDSSSGSARDYIAHRSAGGSNTWTFNWIAPDATVDGVTFYLVGNGANGNGNTAGDSIYQSVTASFKAADTPTPSPSPTPTATTPVASTPTNTPTFTPQPSPTNTGTPGCIDVDEPNNTCDDALPIALGTPEPGALCAFVGNIDYFSSPVTAGNRYRVATINLGASADTRLTITSEDCLVTYGSNGDNPDTGGPDSLLEFTAPNTEILKIRVESQTGFSSGTFSNYEVIIEDVTGQATSTPIPTATSTPTPALCLDQSEPNDSCGAAKAMSPALENFIATGIHCNAFGEQDYFSFPATAGNSYEIFTTTLGTSADTVITLYNGDCSQILGNNDDNPSSGGPDSYLYYTFTEDMTAKINVYPASQFINTGSLAYYTLFVRTIAATPTPGGDTPTPTPTTTPTRTPVPTVIQTTRLYAGWNGWGPEIISLQASSASALQISASGDCNLMVLGRYTEGWELYLSTFPHNDFLISPSRGYFLYAESDCTFDIWGFQLSGPVPVALNYGWNIISFDPGSSITAASDIVDKLDAQGLEPQAIAVYSHETGSAKWLVHVPGVSMTDFPVQSGQGIFVYCMNNGLWLD